VCHRALGAAQREARAGDGELRRLDQRHDLEDHRKYRDRRPGALEGREGRKGSWARTRRDDGAILSGIRPRRLPLLATSDSQYLDALVHRARDRRRLHQGRKGETGEQRGLGADVVAVIGEIDQLSLLDLQQVQLQLPLQVILRTKGQARDSCGREGAEDS